MDFIKRHRKKILTAVAIVTAVITIIIIANCIYVSSHSLDCKITKAENGHIVLSTTLDELKTKDIEPGDDVEITLTTGYKSKETPILYGDYLNSGQHLITINEDASQIIFKVQYIDDIYTKADCKEDTTANIKLNKKATYTYLNNAMKIPQLENANDIRPLKGGNIKGLTFFRGPDPSGEDTFVINYYFKSLNINNTVNLDSQKTDIKHMNLDVLYCNYMIIDTLRALCKSHDKTYFYSADNDYTGYFCAIVEGLAGASYDEIVADYMETYKNLYDITQTNHPDEYSALKTYHIDWFLRKLIKTTPTYDLSKCDYSYAIEIYLRSQGLSSEEISQLKSWICI